jgi:aspartyl protease family protein
MRTASGTGYGALVRIDRLEVAGRELHDVPAVVMQGLTTNLLGQSALKQLGKVELQGDRMVIKPV